MKPYILHVWGTLFFGGRGVEPFLQHSWVLWTDRGSVLRGLAYTIKVWNAWNGHRILDTQLSPSEHLHAETPLPASGMPDLLMSAHGAGEKFSSKLSKAHGYEIHFSTQCPNGANKLLSRDHSASALPFAKHTYFGA